MTGLFAVAGLLGVVPVSMGVASAATAQKSAVTAPRAIGTMEVWGNGIPRTFKRGSTVSLRIWYRQKSPDILAPGLFGLSLWNFAAPGFGQLRGISATWLDPATHRWEKATQYESNGWIGFSLPGYTPTVKVTPNYWAHVDVRIAFGGTAHTGLWHFEPQVSSYSLLTPHGTYDANYLDYSFHQFTSTIHA